MITASIKELKDQLTTHSQKELISIILRLARFKKENKELLTYLLFDAQNERIFVQSVQNEIDELFDQINTSSFYYIKKSIRKTLRTLKKYIRYSQKKETEVELLIYFCKKMSQFTPHLLENHTLKKLLLQQVEHIRKVIGKLHEDLQYDYTLELEELEK